MTQIEHENWRSWRPPTGDGKGLLAELREPRYPMQAVQTLDKSITYRKVHAWERASIILPYRETEQTGWRRFSFKEVVLLLLINDLRRMGMKTPPLRHTLRGLAENPPGISMLEMLLVSSMRGGCYVVLVDSMGGFKIPLSTAELVNKLQHKDPRGLVICCPLWHYVRQILSLHQIHVEVAAAFKLRELSPVQEQVLDLIADPACRRFEITKNDDGILTVNLPGAGGSNATPSDSILVLDASRSREGRDTGEESNPPTKPEEDPRE
ncbi:MAG: MerR family transcriptional regulator [candidate division Zixibacteria bacterium]|nr:MerR family transcriptional regulator [candidate division Zixibacteria bacterium]